MQKFKTNNQPALINKLHCTGFFSIFDTVFVSNHQINYPLYVYFSKII